MSKPHAIRALEKQRANLRARIVQCEAEIAKSQEAIAHIEATLALLRDAKRKGTPAGKSRRWLFCYGELGPLIREIEAGASEPMRAQEVAAVLMARKGWPADDEQLKRFLAGKVKNARRLIPRGAANSPSTSG